MRYEVSVFLMNGDEERYESDNLEEAKKVYSGKVADSNVDEVQLCDLDECEVMEVWQR